jgi:hypothetical protein
MANVKLYGSTGTFPNLTKNAGDLKYEFYPEPVLKWNLSKNLDKENIPYVFLPFVYDSFVMDRKITVKGSITSTTVSSPIGTKTLLERFNDLDKLTAYQTTWSNQPTVDVWLYPLCLEITFPCGNTREAFVVIDSLSIDWAGGENNRLTYDLTLTEVSDLMLM